RGDLAIYSPGADVDPFGLVGAVHAVYLGQGDGSFQVVQNSLSQPLAAGDFDSDGKLDLFTDSGIHLGNGDGTFDSTPLLVAGLGNLSSGTTFTTADLNGDSQLDLVAADTNAEAVAVFLGQGGGAFQAPEFFAAGAFPIAAVAADLNGDGRVD